MAAQNCNVVFNFFFKIRVFDFKCCVFKREFFDYKIFRQFFYSSEFREEELPPFLTPLSGAAHVWNTLSSAVVRALSLSTFKKKLKLTQKLTPFIQQTYFSRFITVGYLPTLRYRRHCRDIWLKSMKFNFKFVIKIFQKASFVWQKTA